MNLPQPPPQDRRPSTAPQNALIIMVIVVAAMALLSLYANMQRWHRDKIETVVVTPAASPPLPTR